MKKTAFSIADQYLQKAENTRAGGVETGTAIPSRVAGDITEGPLIAVEICSSVLEAHIWLAFEHRFEPNDGQAVFYADEIEFLKTKTPAELKEIHKVKLAFGPGSRVRR